MQTLWHANISISGCQNNFKMITFPNAKINIGLNIVSRRTDGYHNIVTLFYPIRLCDSVEVVESSTLSLRTFGRAIDCPPDKNLVMKAYRLLADEFALPPVEIDLYKHIPDGAGLGGGSSDAAHLAVMLNKMFALGLTESELAKRLVRIGADCPFFVYNRPMLASGIGDILEPFDLDLGKYRIVVVKPDVYVSTAQAYAGVTPKEPTVPLNELLQRPIAEWRDAVVNDFETSVFAKFPQLADIKQAFYRSGAVYSAMSGSGSAIFGIFDSDTLAESCAKTLNGYLL